jgi:hypothetical protein
VPAGLRRHRHPQHVNTKIVRQQRHDIHDMLT